ncbi:unnamed protein product [Thelazia callipaeda]|uniref:Transcription factor n=1 Tax=Thelazia callipaeda TaxID=103827 RepID=A0A0N5CXD7_THECL|nr:unnamed protein product [Thelazia callipaeda]
MNSTREDNTLQKSQDAPNFLCAQNLPASFIPSVPSQIYPPTESFGNALFVGNINADNSGNSFQIVSPNSFSAVPATAVSIPMLQSSQMSASNILPENKALPLDERDESKRGMIQWFQQTLHQSEFLSKMASKAKSGLDSVLTTLDPGMRDFIEGNDVLYAFLLSEGNMRITEAIKQGLRQAFNELICDVSPAGSEAIINYQIIGHVSAWQRAKERLTTFRNETTLGSETVLIVVQPFLFQISDYWFDSSLILAQKEGIEVSVFTQATQIDSDVITVLKKHTPKGDLHDSFATTVGYGYAELYGGDPNDWHQNILSFSSFELYRAAAFSLAANLKRILAA